MARKKTVRKAAKKKAKKPAATAKRKKRAGMKGRIVCCNEQQQWAKKIARIALMAGDPPCTGIHSGQGDEYPYTRAVEVFGHYHEHLLDNGIVIIPGEVRTFRDRRTYRVECEWKIVDSDTGYGVSMWSSGLGNNGVWSLNSAVTVAKKQLLLMLFMAKWPAEYGSIEVDPDQAWQNLWETATPREFQGMLAGYFEAVHNEMQQLRSMLETKTKRRRSGG